MQSIENSQRQAIENATLLAFKKKLAETLPPEVMEQIEKLLRDSSARCNKCDIIVEDFSDAISVNQSWGYESVGKDTDRDHWLLCANCSQDFRNQHHIICGGCKRSILDVTATLYSKNPNSSFYGRYGAALAHYRSNRHCGLQFALIEGIVLCEVCYENFIMSFKNPIINDGYLVFDGDTLPGEKPVQENRVDRCFTHWKAEDAVLLSWDDLLVVRNSADAPDKIVQLTYDEDNEELRQYMRDRGHDDRPELRIQTGDARYLSIKIEDLFRELGLSFKTPREGFDTLKLNARGDTITIGNQQISSLTLLGLCAKHDKPD